MKLRVYDAGANFADRYTLYFPYPKWLREHDKVKAYELDFNFSHGWLHYMFGYEVPLGGCLRHGKRIKPETLPQYVREWIATRQKAWDILCEQGNKENAEELWDAWNRDDFKRLFSLAA